MELKDLVQAKQEYMNRYMEQYNEKLCLLLKECGLYGKEVVLKDGTKGVLRVENMEIKFYPYKKDNTVSNKCKYVGLHIYEDNTDATIREKIQKIFKTAGEE